jgi:hypothetical protein
LSSVGEITSGVASGRYLQEHAIASLEPDLSQGADQPPGLISESGEGPSLLVTFALDEQDGRPVRQEVLEKRQAERACRG